MVKYKERIYELFQSMEEAIEFIRSKISVRDIDDGVVDVINVFIDSFVSINDSVAAIKNKELEYLTEKVANVLVEIVLSVEDNNYVFICEAFNSKILNEFYNWKKAIEKNVKFKIIAYGANDYHKILSDILNSDRVDIVAYIDETKQSVGKYLNGKEIISIDNIEECSYDYILLLGGDCNVLNRKIESGIINLDRCFDFWRYFTTNFDYNFYRRYCEFLESDKNYEGVITGLSYCEVGINVNYLKKKFYNFAVSSQDLFYDYKIMKYVLSYKELKNRIKYVIIGLSYYNFQYDMSKSNRKIRTNIYYPIFRTMHNYENAAKSIEQYKKFKEKSELLLCKDFEKNIYVSVKEGTEKYLNKLYKNKFDSKNLTSKEMLVQKELVQTLFNKDYPDTVKENKKIFREYLELLKHNNIKPIVVVCPHNKFFVKNSSERIMKEFLSIIKEFKNDYKFQFIDYFSSNEFDDDDFYDVSHLNCKGAEKFTKILNDAIKWE